MLYKKYKLLFTSILHEISRALIGKRFEYAVEICGTVEAYFVRNLTTVHFRVCQQTLGFGYSYAIYVGSYVYVEFF